MLPDRVSNPGPLTYKSGALPIALRGPAIRVSEDSTKNISQMSVQFLTALGMKLDLKVPVPSYDAQE